MADHEIVRMRVAPSEFSGEFAILHGAYGYWYYARVNRKGELVADQWFAGDTAIPLPDWVEDEAEWRQTAVAKMLAELSDES